MFQVLVAQSSHLFKIHRCIHRGLELHFTYDSSDCLLRLTNQHFDALVLKYELHKTDDVCVRHILSEAGKRNISTFFISAQMEEEVLSMLFQYDISYYFLEPVSFQQLYQKVSSVKAYDENTLLNKSVTSLLHTLGIPNSVQGYFYIKEAIMYCYYNEQYKKGVTKNLYPLLASQHSTTAGAVEKSIRHAIELAFNQCDQNSLYEFFKGTIRVDKAKATNSQFIAMCVDYIKSEEL